MEDVRVEEQAFDAGGLGLGYWSIVGGWVEVLGQQFCRELIRQEKNMVRTVMVVTGYIHDGIAREDCSTCHQLYSTVQMSCGWLVFRDRASI